MINEMKKTGSGEDVSTVSTNPASTGKGTDVSAGNIGAPDTQGVQAAAASAGQTEESAGHPLEITRKVHTHAGKDYKKGETIMLDVAEYRWALTHKIGKPGKAEHVGKAVNSQGVVVSSETEKTIEELEAEASK
jgi:hypothetical protein